MSSALETAGPYTLHIAVVLWIVAAVVLIRERRNDRKK